MIVLCSPKMKEIDLVKVCDANHGTTLNIHCRNANLYWLFTFAFLCAQSVISQKVVLSHGYYCFDVQSGQKSFSLGFPEKYEADSWLEVLLEVAGKKPPLLPV